MPQGPTTVPRACRGAALSRAARARSRAPGSGARVPPASPIIMDVFLLDVPGFDLPDEEEEVVPAPAPAEEAAPAPEAAAAEVVA